MVDPITHIGPSYANTMRFEAISYPAIEVHRAFNSCFYVAELLVRSISLTCDVGYLVELQLRLEGGHPEAPVEAELLRVRVHLEGGLGDEIEAEIYKRLNFSVAV